MIDKSKSNWPVVVLLLVLGAIPALPGAFILNVIQQGPPEVPGELVAAHYFTTPIPIKLHILAGILFSALCPFQFSPLLRGRWPKWHRWSGCVVIVCGIMAGVSSIWMVLFFPATGGFMRSSGLFVSGIGVIISLGIATSKVLHRNIASHRAWMMRSVAIMFGASAPAALVLIPMALISGQASEIGNELGRWVGMFVNLAVVEWILRREQSGRHGRDNCLNRARLKSSQTGQEPLETSIMQLDSHRVGCSLVVLYVCSCFSGCATTAMQSDAPIAHRDYGTESACEIDIERGKRRPILDGVGWVAGIPTKLLLFDSRADNHNVGDDTERQLVSYMARNYLHDTKVRLNQYDPLGEWRRLRENGNVGPGWRYTLGTLHTLGYTVFPGRVFGRDRYNPYSDSIHIYSDIPALALEQAAYAKDVHQRSRPGTYAAAQELPFVGLWHERLSKQDVHDYYAVHGTPNDQREARHILHPQFGSEVGEQIDSILVVGEGVPVFQVTGAAIGHVAGRIDGMEVSDAPMRPGN